MGNQIPKAYTFEIENFSQRNTQLKSPLFSSRHCNWYVTVYPTGHGITEHISLFLAVSDPLSRPYWSRLADYRFVIVNPSNVRKNKNLRSVSQTFNSKRPSWGFHTGLSLSNLQETGFLVNDKLIIKVYINVRFLTGGRDDPALLNQKVYVNDNIGGRDDPPLLNQKVYVNGFQVVHSQVKAANWIFETYPETALYIHPQDPQLKTVYMNILLRIYEKLYNSPLKNLTEAELTNVSKGLLDLTQAGFKLEWLREKLDKVSVERKKLNVYEAQVQELGKQLKNVELMMCNLKDDFRLIAAN